MNISKPFPREWFYETTLKLPHQRYGQLLKYFGRPHDLLMIAVREGNTMMVRDILRLRQLGVHDLRLNRVLAQAAQFGQIEVIKMLIAMCSDHEYDYDQALRQAAMHGHLEIVKYLIQLSGSTNEFYLDLDDALSVAAGTGQREIVEFLSQVGATDFDRGARQAAFKGQLGMVQLLLQLGSTDLIGILDVAAKWGQIKVAEYMMHHGATDLSGALSCAAIHGQTEMVQFLLKFPNHSQKALNESLLEAARYGYLEIIGDLIDAGANNLARALQLARESSISIVRGHHTVTEYLEFRLAESSKTD